MGPSIWQDLTYFEREAELLQQISHTAIPKFIDYFELKIENHHGFVLVQQYIPARSLSQHRHQGRTFSEVDIKQIIEQVLEILIYLHQQDPPIIHRDIKPSNLLLCDRSAHSVGQIHLVDFGVAKTLTESIGKTLTVVGSYGYAPLEQFGGRSVPASDIYSLGATIVYLLTGRHPAELPQVDLTIQFETATNISSDLKNWIKTATQPFLDRRFLNAKAALDNLNHPVAPDLFNTRKPHGTEITCRRFETFLQIEKPRKNQAYNKIYDVISPILSGIVFLVFTVYPLAVMSFIFIITWTFNGFLLSLAIVFSLAIISITRATTNGRNKHTSPPLLVHENYQFSKDEVRHEKYFDFMGTPQVETIKLPDLKQIDRISEHSIGHEVEHTDAGTITQRTYIPSRIEFRSDEVTFTIDNLKEPEVDWLCAELSEYLGIPVATHTIEE